MNKTQATTLEKTLVSKREELLHTLNRARQDSQDVQDFGGDEADHAAASQSKDLTFLQQAQERELLNLVEGGSLTNW